MPRRGFAAPGHHTLNHLFEGLFARHAAGSLVDAVHLGADQLDALAVGGFGEGEQPGQLVQPPADGVAAAGAGGVDAAGQLFQRGGQVAQ